MSRALRWKHGRLKGWSIDRKGAIICEYDADYQPQSRIRGKKNHTDKFSYWELNGCSGCTFTALWHIVGWTLPTVS